MKIKPLAVIGECASEKITSSLLKKGFDVLTLPAYDKLGAGVMAHADMLIFKIDNKIFTYEDYANKNKDIFTRISHQGYAIITAQAIPNSKYPNDIALNCLHLSKFIFCRIEYCADEIRKYALSNGYTLVNLKQGYARCTSAPVSENALISADKSTISTAEGLGIDTLTVSIGNIMLPPYEYGFIGGCCGSFEDKIYFSGSISTHPDFIDIVNFCKKHKKEPVCLTDEPLYDIGSIFFL